MDIIVPIIIMILIFITCSICGYCCKRNKQGIVYGVPTTVTTHTTHIPGGMQQTPAAPGFAPHAGYPATTPYPTHGGHVPPYPPVPGDGYTGTTPYPPMPMPGSGAYTAPVPPYPPQSSAAHQLPPSYAEAVTQPPPPTNELYAKQSPYNPNYN